MIVNYFVDICKYWDGSLANKVLDIISEDLKRSSNFMHSCPQPVSIVVKVLSDFNL